MVVSDERRRQLHLGGAGDFDGDGSDELLWHKTSTGVVGFHDVTDGGTSWNAVGNAGGSYVVAGTGDYNGDGKDDVLWYNTANGNVG